MSNNKIWKIYCYTSNITGQKYIGYTRNSLKQRANGSLGQGYVRTKYFGPLIIEYGFDSFTPSILKKVHTREEAIYWEEFFIKKFNTIYPNGLNDSVGYKLSERRKRMEYGKSFSSETKKKISESVSGERNGAYGKHWFTNGVISIRSFECPDSFYPGRVIH